MTAAAVGAATVALVTGCGGGSGSSEPVERRGSEAERTLEVVNGLADGVSVVPFTGGSGTPVILGPGRRTRSGGVPEAGRDDLCVALGRVNEGVVRVSLVVSDDVMKVTTPARCPGRPSTGDPQATWQAGVVSGSRLLESGFPGAQLCLERLGRLTVQARIEPVGTFC